MAGLCVGALGAMLVTVAQFPARDAAQATPIAASSKTTTSTSPASTPGNPVPDESGPGSLLNEAVDPGKLAALEPGSGTNLSVAVYDRREQKLTTSYHPALTYTTASLVKVFIALEAEESGDIPAATVKQMLARSDDNIASELWSRLGGPDIVRHWVTKIGLHDTKPPEDAGHWGNTRISAPDMVAVYRYLLEREPAAKRKIILDGMAGATEQGADGFRQYYGIADATGKIPWAIKQGWSCCGPERTLHSTGILGSDNRYIVVVLSTMPSSTGYETGAKRVTDVVKLLVKSRG